MQEYNLNIMSNKKAFALEMSESEWQFEPAVTCEPSFMRPPTHLVLVIFIRGLLCECTLNFVGWLPAGLCTASNQGISPCRCESSICQPGLPLCFGPTPCDWALVRLFGVLRPKACVREPNEDTGRRKIVADRKGKEKCATEVCMSFKILQSYLLYLNQRMSQTENIWWLASSSLVVLSFNTLPTEI